MNNTRGLYSIILTHYNQTDFITEAIDSILSQSYGSLELIIIDDCSKEFNQEEITKYIEANKNSNLKSYKIIVNEKNIGTVLSLTKAINSSTGEYISFLAADDALYDNKNIEHYIDALIKYNCNMITTKTVMMDETLKIKVADFPENDISYINDISPIEQYKLIAKSAIFASGAVCYKRLIFDEYKLSLKYKLVEDWPFHLYLTRMGEKFYFQNRYSLKHRAGGVSENENINKKIIMKVTKDIMTAYKTEIFPYINTMEQDDKNKIYEVYKYHILRIKQYNYIAYLYYSILLKFKG